MSTTPRIPAALAAGFTMLGDGSATPASRIAIPIELTRLSGIPIASAGSILLDPVVHEGIRLFNANYQGCEYCMNARQAIAVQAGLNEDIVQQLTRFEVEQFFPQPRILPTQLQPFLQYLGRETMQVLQLSGIKVSQSFQYSVVGTQDPQRSSPTGKLHASSSFVPFVAQA